MKKIFLWGVMATLALGSCSEDNGVVSGNGETDGTESNAYLTVRITNADAGTRAAGDEDNPFENGTAAEHTVSDARFFFYDADGNYVTEATVWNGGTPEEENGNVEFNGNTVIVLKDVTGTNYPKNLVTVLNAPTGFTPGETLTKMEEKMAGGVEGIYKSSSAKNFIMSTTSYVRTTGNDTPYCVTELRSGDFSLEPISNNPNAVKVYVERLAAKVMLTLSDELKEKEDNGFYHLKVTVVGGDNEADNGNAGTPPVAAEDIYVKLGGWALNATAKDSYLLKKIDPSWTEESTSLGFTWNDAAHYRSYWGMSYNYGKNGNYPTEGQDEISNEYLNYISSDEITNALGTAAYCAENTNNATYAAKAAARTSILLKATICDGDGNPLDMVRYNGVLFKNDTYIDYLLNATKGDWDAWYCTKEAEEGEEATYSQLDKTCVELVDKDNGLVNVQVKKDVKLYKRSGTDPDFIYTEFEEADLNTLNNTLAAFNATNEANGYKGGLMYYNIPIEHLRTIESGQEGVKEGNYGVVRNHYYKVTINSLENVGKGIFDPDEDIVPGDDDNKRYYLGASIQILSWKIVEQSVDL